MPNLDNSELIHAFGSTWKNHKYIKKIGNRYFYTMDELRNYKTNNRAKTKETSSIQPRVTRESVAENRKYFKKIGNRQFKTRDEYDDYITSLMREGKMKPSFIYNENALPFVSKYPNTSRKFKTKQSISDTITSGVKKAGEKISDVTGLTAKKRAEAAEQRSDILAKKAAYSKKELDAASNRKNELDRTVREMQEKAQLYEDEASKSKAAADVKKYEKLLYENDKAADAMEKAGGQYKYYAPYTRETSDYYRQKVSDAQKEVDKLTEPAKSLRLNSLVMENTFAKLYSRDVASAQRKYEADLKAYEAVLSDAQTYREQYGNTVAGKLEKAANDVQMAYNDVVRSASDAIDIGKQFAMDQAAKVSTSVSELTTKASDSVASGLAWVESVFAPKKKK